MSILFAANLAAGFSAGSVCAGSNTGGQAGYEELSGSSTLFAPVVLEPIATGTGELDVKFPSSQTDFWLGFAFYRSSATTLTYSIAEFGVWGGNKSFAIRLNSNTPTLEWWNGSAWTVISTAPTRLNSKLYGPGKHRFDVHMNVHATTGFIRVYLHGKLILSYSGDTAKNSVTTVDKVAFPSNSSFTYYGEVLVATRKTIGLRINTVSVTGAGGVSGFTTGSYADVDEEGGALSAIDTDYMQSDTADQIHVVALDNLGQTNWGVRAVVVNARCWYTGAAPQKANVVVRMASTNYHGTDKTIGTAGEGIQDVWETNPNTSAAWTSADITNLEVGVRSRT